MATTVVLTEVVKEQAPSTRVLVKFADGTTREFASMAQLTQLVTQPDQDVSLARNLCLAYALARSADLSNIASVANKNFTFDLSDNSPIKVQ